MDIHPIHTDEAHRSALREIEMLMSAEAGTAEGDKLDILVTLVEAWERKHFPLELPDPIEAIKFRMEQTGMTPKDLQPMIGSRNRVYEVLNRKRGLTLPMIRKLHAGLGIPVESLIKEAGGSARLILKGIPDPAEIYFFEA